jgi:AraC-like DNA-binding protein
MTFNIAAILSLLVAFQLLFMAVYLFSLRRGNRRNNRLLAFLFLMFAINMLDFAARTAGLIFHLPFLHLLDDSFFLLYGPLIYFYTQGVVYRDFAFKNRDLVHIIPFLTLLLYSISQIILVDRETQMDLIERVITAEVPAWIAALGIMVYFHILLYLFISRKVLLVYRSVLKDKFSSVETINLDWLSFIIRMFFVITLVAMINAFLPVFKESVVFYVSAIILLLLCFLFINLVLVRALNQSVIFSGIQKEETEKYAASSLELMELEHYKLQLLKLMEKDKLFLNSDLKSQDLADELGISPKLLSQVINQGFQKSFFDFINTYRCEEVKRILQGPDKNVTIIEAMYTAGFNSKSSFNKEFKKLMKMTPREFKNSLK